MTLEVQVDKNTENHDPTFLRSLGPHITCGLCAGYLIDATTLSECMHSFCRSCIVQYLDRYASCPTCGVHLIRSRSCEQLRPDPVLQSIVYKVVPGLYQEELKRRHDFYQERPHYVESSRVPLVPTLAPSTFYSPSDPISLSLDYLERPTADTALTETLQNETVKRRYFRCPAAVTVYHFQKLLSLKFNLDSSYKVQVLCCGEILPTSYRLLDIAYIYKWTQEAPLQLHYQIVSAVTPPPPPVEITPVPEIPQITPKSTNDEPTSATTTPFLKPLVPVLPKKSKSSRHRRHQKHVRPSKEGEIASEIPSSNSDELLEDTPAPAPTSASRTSPPSTPLPPPPSAPPSPPPAVDPPLPGSEPIRISTSISLALPSHRKKSKRSKMKKSKREHKKSHMSRGSMVQAIHQLLKKKLRVSQEKFVPVPTHGPRARKRALSSCELSSKDPPEKIRKTHSASTEACLETTEIESTLVTEPSSAPSVPYLPKVEDCGASTTGSMLGLLVAAAEVASTSEMSKDVLPAPSAVSNDTPDLSVPSSSETVSQVPDEQPAPKEVLTTDNPTPMEVEISSNSSPEQKIEKEPAAEDATHDVNGALDLTTKSRRSPAGVPTSAESAPPAKDRSDLKETKLAAIDLIIPSTTKLTARKSITNSNLHIYPSPSPSPSPNSLQAPDDSSSPSHSVTITEVTVPAVSSRQTSTSYPSVNRLAPSQKLTSIADSLAQRQHQLLSLKLSQHAPPPPPSTERFIVHPNPVTTKPAQRQSKLSRSHHTYQNQPSDALRNLLTLSQTAALVSRAPPLPAFSEASLSRTATSPSKQLPTQLLQTLRNNMAASLQNSQRFANHPLSVGLNRTLLNSSASGVTFTPTSSVNTGSTLPVSTSAYRVNQRGITVQTTTPSKKMGAMDSEPLMHPHSLNRSVRHIPNPSLLQQRRSALNSAVAVLTPSSHSSPVVSQSNTHASEHQKLPTN